MRTIKAAEAIQNDLAGKVRPLLTKKAINAALREIAPGWTARGKGVAEWRRNVVNNHRGEYSHTNYLAMIRVIVDGPPGARGPVVVSVRGGHYTWSDRCLSVDGEYRGATHEDVVDYPEGCEPAEVATVTLTSIADVVADMTR